MKTFLAGAMALVFSTVMSPGVSAAADDYPSRPVTLIAGFPAGSGADVYARFFAKKLEEKMKQTFLVDNKPGGLGSLSVVALKNAKPDGYTLLIASADQLTAAPYIFNNPPYDPIKDFEYIAPVFSQAFMMLVNAKSPYKHISELTAAMKEKGDKASYSTSNFPSTILGEMYKVNAGGLQTQQVRYKTAADRSQRLSPAARSTIRSATRFSACSLARRDPASAGRLDGEAHFLGAGYPDIRRRRRAECRRPHLVGSRGAEGHAEAVIDTMYKAMTEVTTSEDARKFVGTNGGEPMTLESPQATLDYATMDTKRWEEWAKIGKLEKQ